MAGSRITGEQPPVNTEGRLAEYLNRMFKDARISDEQHDQFTIRTILPEKISVGKPYYFLNAVLPDITAEGFWYYDSTDTWIQMAGGGAAGAPCLFIDGSNSMTGPINTSHGGFTSSVADDGSSVAFDFSSDNLIDNGGKYQRFKSGAKTILTMEYEPDTGVSIGPFKSPSIIYDFDYDGDLGRIVRFVAGGSLGQFMFQDNNGVGVGIFPGSAAFSTTAEGTALDPAQIGFGYNEGQNSWAQYYINGTYNTFQPATAVNMTLGATNFGDSPNGKWAGAYFQDGAYVYFGDNADCSIRFNGAFMVINPKHVGSGVLWLQGTQKIDDHLVFPKTIGKGIKVDTSLPDWPWHDLLGEITEGSGSSKPSHLAYKGNIKQFRFGSADEAYINYHMPHDYAPGTDLFIHVHWSHTNAGVTGGNVTFRIESTYAKGHQQGAGSIFGANKVLNLTANAGAQYEHMVSEIQMSVSGGSPTEHDTGDVEVDSMFLTRIVMQARNMTGSNPEVFIHQMDIHYQSTNIGTKDKAPNFYT